MLPVALVRPRIHKRECPGARQHGRKGEKPGISEHIQTRMDRRTKTIVRHSEGGERFLRRHPHWGYLARPEIASFAN